MQKQIGKYEIIRPLGHGSMGQVLLGRDPLLGRDVAIKTISSSSQQIEEAKTRFAREAQATAALNHPHIVTVFDYGFDQDQHYLVMEYVDGKDFQTLLDEHTLTLKQNLEILAQICEALSLAHDHGIIHRDIKPSNILVSLKGKKPLAKLTDFGVAAIQSSSLTQQGVWMGTISYMAPEYLDTGKASASSDLFAIGVILYEILTGGRKPFTGESTTSILNAILRSAMASLTADECKAYPTPMIELLYKCLEREPAHRYTTGEHLAEAIRSVIPLLEAPRPATPPPPVPPPKPERPPTQPRLSTEAPRSLTVGKGPGAQCMSLRVALRQLADGGLIKLLPGTHHECLQIEKDVEIVGEGQKQDILLECCLKTSAKVVLRNLHLHSTNGHPIVECLKGSVQIQNCACTSEKGLAFHTQPQTQLDLETCTLEGQGQILRMDAGAKVQMKDCTLDGTHRRMIELSHGAQLLLSGCTLSNEEGVGVFASTNAQIEAANTQWLKAPQGGIELDRDAKCTLKHCQIQNSQYAGLLALGKSQAHLEDCTLRTHGASAVYAAEGASVQLNQCQIIENGGFGLVVMNDGRIAMEDCDIQQNGHAGLRIHEQGSAQLKNCRITQGKSVGILCSKGGRGILEGCEISGNAKAGAQVESGGSLLLAKCIIRDGQETGLLLFEDSETTLEECVVHRNARGGILLTKDASDPQLRGDNQIEDQMVRLTEQGPVKLAPLKKH